jgi:hypothetical protein
LWQSKEKRPLCGLFSFSPILLLEALAAVYRAILTGLERNLARISAACANCIIHLTLGLTLASLCLTLVAASFATKGLVLKTLLGIKFLLSGSKSEFLSTIFADQCFVVIHDIPLFSRGSCPLTLINNTPKNKICQGLFAIFFTNY